MSQEKNQRPSPIAILFALLVMLAMGVVAIEKLSQWLLERQRAGHVLPPRLGWLARLINRYLDVRYIIEDHWILTILAGLLFLVGIAYLLRGLKRLAARMNRWREQASGMAFKKETYDLKQVRLDPARFLELIDANPDPDTQVLLGVDMKKKPVYLTDLARSMHVHVLGQTGSGKTRSVIEPLMFQDLWRRRGVLVVDAKGSQENEHRLAAMAAATGRLDQLKVFTLNPYHRTHTYNPLHLTPGADPKAVAERVFSSFADDMDVPYYRDQSRLFFVDLVCALASSGKRFSMLDVAAAISSRRVLRFALDKASDRTARRAIDSQLAGLGRKAGETFTGLLAAVRRYDTPAVNAYEPDIVLEEEIDRDGVVGFFLPANYYKQLARYIGLCVFQHLQQVGSLRQLNRERRQKPLYCFADEFYSFGYEGFTDAVNKLRDANVSILLSHQTVSDLEKVSKEFSKGIWDNTRNKIVLYQNDPEVCDRIAKGLGTVKDVELTVRRSIDGWMNNVSMEEASSKEVDAYRCHPNRIKSLKLGQAYLAQDTQFVGINLQLLPELPKAQVPAPKTSKVEGLGLHDLFVAGKDSRAKEEK